ncbi:MAG: hypothetical protein AAF984_08600 [Verrucomicrobiota bacterium]
MSLSTTANNDSRIGTGLVWKHCDIGAKAVTHAGKAIEAGRRQVIAGGHLLAQYGDVVLAAFLTEDTEKGAAQCGTS